MRCDVLLCCAVLWFAAVGGTDPEILDVGKGVNRREGLGGF